MSNVKPLLHRLADKLRVRSRAIRTSLFGYPVLDNVNGAAQDETTRRALLIYLTEPFLLRDDDARFLDHQNLRQCKQIASLLGEAGYVVDVADYQDAKLVQNALKRKYDLILSHRGDLGRAGAPLPSHSIKVYLASGMNHTHYNRNLRQRYARLLQRRPCQLPTPGWNREELPFVDSVDAVAGFGNEHTAGTWRERTGGPVFLFNNYAPINASIAAVEKDYERVARNFLFFASRNQVGKGLDVLLEIFPRHPDLHLYVCSLFAYEREFTACYHHELFETPNIHPVGAVKPGTAEFGRILDDCAFVIHPSCSEGQPGSVVQAMHGGLIPLVTRESGIDVDGFGWRFDDDSEESIERVTLQAAGTDSEELRSRARRTVEVARELYSEQAFLLRWREIIREIENLATRKQQG